MDLEQFTDRARGFLQAAQTSAQVSGNQQITPEHLLKALLSDEQGMCAELFRQAGGDAKQALSRADLQSPSSDL